MKQIAAAISQFSQSDIQKVESEGKYQLNIEGNEIILELEELEISSQDIPGWLVASTNRVTVALDVAVQEWASVTVT